MARRKEKNRKTGRGAPTALDTPTLDQRASGAKEAGHFREAVELYKELLKRERRPEWLDGLAEGYAGRARELAAKGMVKEALALWDNRAERCGVPPPAEDQLALLLAGGHAAEAVRFYIAYPEPAALKGLEPRIATALLAASDEALAGLPADTPLLRHRTAALEAFAAFGRGDAAAADAAAASIPFRSPLRELRPLLKALNTATEAPAEAQRAVAKITADGPFGRLAAAVRAATLPSPQWLTALHPLDDGMRRLVLDLKGIEPKTIPLLLKLAALGERPAPAALLGLLIEQRRLFPAGTAEALGRRLLPHLPPPQWARYGRAFGALPAAEETRLDALADELEGFGPDAETAWLDLADDYEYGEQQGPDARLKAALILRRLVDDARGPLGEEGLGPLEREWLERSLRLDPGHRDSYLRLVRAQLAAAELKEARATVAAALERFPEDAEVLLRALETAVAGGAFKKAAGYARRVLALDPINPRVHALLGRAHLAHARKQVAANKSAAAQRELSAAAEWLREPADRAALHFLQALAAHRGSGTRKEGTALLDEGLALVGGGPPGLLHLVLELRRNRLPIPHTLAELGVAPPKRLDGAEVVALARAVTALEAEEHELHGLLELLQRPLEKALRASLGEADSRLVCEAFERCGARTLVRICAAGARKRWPDAPVFVYYETLARHGDRPSHLPKRTEEALHQALVMARDGGDLRTAVAIERLLRAVATPFDDFEGWDEEDEDEDELWDDLAEPPSPAEARREMETMVEQLGEKAFLQEMNRVLGKPLVRELENAVGKQRLIEAIIEMMTLGGLPPLPPPRRRPEPSPARPTPAKPRRKPRDPAPAQRNLFDDD
ncbi:tetratricopeptide repeat protein [Endothiovibrio diazotrophicus]